jgi:SAM-dependent methyltransferase
MASGRQRATLLTFIAPIPWSWHLMSEPVSSAAFWNARYLEGDTGWDKGRPSPPIARMIADGDVAPCKVAVLGAGRGHEALALASHGFDVTAIDFAEEACRAIQEAAVARGLTMDVLQADLFELGDTHARAFDAVLENTCFCAIDPDRRAEYAKVVERVVRPAGTFFGLFYAHGRPGGPPFTTSEAEVRALFGPGFEVTRLVRAADSLPGRAGEELEFVFRRRD